MNWKQRIQAMRNESRQASIRQRNPFDWARGEREALIIHAINSGMVRRIPSHIDLDAHADLLTDGEILRRIVERGEPCNWQ